MPFTLVIPDLVAAPAPASEPPALPALDRLLSWGGRHAVAAHWREGVALDLGLNEAARRSVAQVAAWALPTLPAAGSGVVLATPVHCIAGISRVNLHPAGVLRLTADELAQLRDSFAGTLGGSELQLTPLPGGFLMHGTPLQAIAGGDPGDPAPLQGGALVAGAPGSMDPLLQRLGTEIQMWLHDHPVNRARERRGALPVTALWLWGAGLAATPVPAHRPLPMAQAEDPWISGLWTASGGVLLPPAAAYTEPAMQERLAIVTIAGSPDRAALQRFDSTWFEPLFEALRSGELSSLALHLGRHRWHVQRRRWSGLWRRPQPWWQRLAA